MSVQANVFCDKLGFQIQQGIPCLVLFVLANYKITGQALDEIIMGDKILQELS